MSNLYSEILSSIAQTRPVTVETLVRGESGLISEGLKRRLVPGVTPVTDPKGRRFARVTAETDGDLLTVCEPVMPRERLIVLGGGHIANRRRFPDAAEVICDSFENGIRRLGITAFDYVVVITRGHRHDADCLRALLPGEEPAYLGMIGSRRRTKGLLEMLKEDRAGHRRHHPGGDRGFHSLRGHRLQAQARARRAGPRLFRLRPGALDPGVSGRKP